MPTSLALHPVRVAVLVSLLAWSSLSAPAIRERAESGHHTGTLIAAFLTPSQILLCSDGRVVDSASGSIVSEQWTKVHRLTDGIGLLTAGRDLPGLAFTIAGDLSRRRSFGLREAVAATARHLQRAWAALPAGPEGRPVGRAFAFLAGFDDEGRPRLFEFDSEHAPVLGAREIPLFDTDQNLDIAAVVTGAGPKQNVSTLIVEHLDRVQRHAPRTDRLKLLVKAFDGVKAELAAANPRIGGETFVASIASTPSQPAAHR